MTKELFNISTKWRVLVGYGVYLLIAGVVGFASNPEKAKTALISGGTFALLSFMLSVPMRSGKAWAKGAALAMLGLLTIVFSWRSWVSFAAVFAGNTEKLFAASLIFSMLLASVVSFVLLLRKN